MSLDIDYVRSQFPALAGGWGFFDNAGGAQVLRNVAERVADYMLTISVQTGAVLSAVDPGERADIRGAHAHSHFRRCRAP